jgi:hypothetical protein
MYIPGAVKKCYYDWSSEEIHTNILDPLDPNGISHHSELDWMSVMMYVPHVVIVHGLKYLRPSHNSQVPPVADDE